MRLLLDECITRRLAISPETLAKFQIVHTVDFTALGPGASDCQIVQFLLRNRHHILVTRDHELFCICRVLKLDCAFFWHGKPLKLLNENVELGDVSKEALKEYCRRNRVKHCWLAWRLVEIRRRLARFVKENIRPLSKIQYTRARKAVKLASCCKQCGTQCRSIEKLQNHVRYEHIAELLPSRLLSSTPSLFVS